ncbi:HAMP domain-containing histidine kinase [Thalassomonas viridans]|uniref:histidine kinase n=1 Tax=Thalassomonas viridans TaxID=137584 RepID=A0AAE9Z4Y4_9GAMM|nr:HAMP domain-containing sensor histidine kinase [Thalassomonas viridans]WDE06155.1 HAMP domain-containing histidine kinase [Thalassomonas viridans]
MNKLYPAKHITIIYFSLIAIALVSIHFSVYQFTTRDLEHLYTNNRLDKIRNHTRDFLANTSVKNLSKMEIQTQGNAAFDKGIQLYFNFNDIPQGFPDADTIPYDEAIELKSGPGGHAYFVSKSQIDTLDGITQVYFIVDNSLYELSEGQLLSLHTKQVIISLSLLALSLFAVIKISAKLTNPISHLARTLSTRSSEDLSPIPLPKDTATLELAKLVETFNLYQQRVKASMERERSFNRYASHELRTPLMVMTGAINLLEESSEPTLVATQCKRLKKATHEMTEFVETLLSLTKSETGSDKDKRQIDSNEVRDIVFNHEYLLENKAVKWNVFVQDPVFIRMPEAAFHILLGNLIKNAFAYTESGTVDVYIDPKGIRVIDTGKGINSQSNECDGYGLGLLLVRDICHRYGWQFFLENDQQQGCIAAILFQQ